MARDRARDIARRPVIQVQPAFKTTGANPISHVKPVESEQEWGERKFGAEIMELRNAAKE